MKRFLKSNVLVWIYFVLVCLIELTAVFVTSGKFYIRSPWIFLIVQMLIVVILLTITSNKARHILASVLLSVFMVVNIVFIVIFEMTETIFDYGMFNLRNDAMGILESVPINFIYFSVSLFLISLYIVFGRRFARKAEKPLSIRFWCLPVGYLILLCLSGVLYYNNKDFEQNVEDKLYRTSEASYCEYGIIGNFLNELTKGIFFTNVELGDETELEDFIYNEDEIYYTNFENNNYNVITILSESLEWHSFMQDAELFVNGHNIQNGEQVLRELYPNLYEFYDSSLVMSNFYSREKTDIAENLSFLGSYPTNVYINYDFPNNTMATTMASTLKTLDNDIVARSFHNGSYTYYNRNKELISAGFDAFYATEQMKAMGMTDWSAKGERNLDTDMINTCADLMFPTDQRFYTYITSITMHGQYTYRKNLNELGYYAKLNQYGITAMSGDSYEAFNHNNFYYYCACVMEFDRALGVIMDELEARGLKDNTIIAIFGDHNTYYSSLSNYVKGIQKTTHANYTNLFRVPLMIKVPNMGMVENYLSTTLLDEIKTQLMSENAGISEEDAEQIARTLINNRYVITNNGTNKQIMIKKFMCTADIVPTLFDLLGINVYGNLYFGHSAFEMQESVMYSRAYDMFITDNMYFVSLNNIKYIREDGASLANDPANKYADLSTYDREDHINKVEIEANKLLKKLSVCNRIFYNDYFARKYIADSTKTNLQIFKEKLININ